MRGQVLGNRMEKRGSAMNIQKKIAKVSVHALVLVLTVTLVTGLSGWGNEALAATSGSSPFANTRSTYQHNGRFDGNLIVHGVDVSYFQAVGSDWNKAKKDGCDYAIMRVTYTTYGSGSLNIDTKFRTHFRKADAAGVMKGVYVFSQAKNATEARKEARYALNRLKSLGIGPEDLELPLYMDYEFAGSSWGSNRGRLYGLTRSKAIKAVNAFADVVRAAGYDPGVYANTTFFNKYLNNGKGLASDIDLWCAQYYVRNESPSPYTKWQYTSTSVVDGIKFYSTNKEGSCDADFWYLNKKPNKSPKGAIIGNTYLQYTGKPVLPELEVYYGNTLLKEGTDYVMGGINNVKKGKGKGYAYIKGIGKYGGYALIPLNIKKSYIRHIGLSGIGTSAVKARKTCSYKIVTSSTGSYIRNVPAGTTAATLIKKLKYDKKLYTLAVINAKGHKIADTAAVTSGMMLGVYRGSVLKATADITVNGKTLNNIGANYLRLADRSKKSFISNLFSSSTTDPVPVDVGSAVASTSTTTTTSSYDDDSLVVDGSGGPATIKALQKLLKVKQTGTIVIPENVRKYSEAIDDPKDGTKDTNTVTAMQKWLGQDADGVWGPGTSRALQSKVGAAVDGFFGKNSMKLLQRYLNKHVK